MKMVPFTSGEFASQMPEIKNTFNYDLGNNIFLQFILFTS